VLFPYAAAYAFLLLFAWRNSDYSHLTVTKYALSVLLAYYALSFFHPQYFVWAVPLVVLLMAYLPNFKWYFAFQLLTLFIYSFSWGNYYGLYLFTPIYPGFFGWPSPRDLIANYADPSMVIGIARSFFSAISLWMVWEMMSTERKTATPEQQEGLK
jgi:hypothetical protein